MISYSEAIGERPSWLVDIDVFGRVFRFTDSPAGAVVTDAAGDSYRYEGGLSRPTLPRAAGPNRSASFSVVGDDLDWRTLIQQGRRVDASAVTLRLWYPGTALERARVMLIGRATSVEFDDEFSPVKMSVSAPDDGTGLVPHPSMVVDSDTFPVRAGYAVDGDTYGADYPVIIGTPGDVADVPISSPYTPGLLVEFSDVLGDAEGSRVLIAGHRVQAGTVTLHHEDTESSAVVTVAHAKDGRGRTYAYVDFTGLDDPSEPQPLAGAEYKIAWDGTAAGAAGRNTPSAVTGAGSVILWLVQTFAPSFQLDIASQSAQRTKLDAYRLDFAITSPADVVSFVRRQLSSILPLDERRTEAGTSWVWRRIRATRDEAKSHLDGTPGAGNVSRITTISVDASKVTNRVVVQYGKGGKQRRFLKRLIVGPSRVADGIEEDARVVESAVAKWSASMWGVRSRDIKAEAVVSAVTALQVAKDIIDAEAIPRRRFVVRGSFEHDRFDPSDVVTYTESRVGLDRVLCIVRSVTVLAASVELALEVDERPDALMQGAL